MPHESILIILAVAAAAVMYWRKRYEGIIPRLYVTVFYIVVWCGFSDIPALQAASRFGYLLLFMTDIIPYIVQKVGKNGR